MRNHVHLASRVFNTPLMIQGGKLDAILAALGKKLHLAEPPRAEDPIEAERLRRKPYQVTPEGIAVISVLGPLVKRSSGHFLSGGPTTYAEIREEFADAATDPAVKGIIFEIDSPGGEVGGLFELADRIYSQRAVKPIYAVADDDAFSAAYMIASAAEKVYVTSTGGVGSVGVYVVHVDQSEFDNKLGVKFTYISAGAKKVDLNPHEPIKDAARAEMKVEIDRLYGLFVDAVARNRSVDPQAIRDTESGLLFGDAGIPLLADKQGTLATAIEDMSKALDAGGGIISAPAAQPAASASAVPDETEIPNELPEAAAESAPQTKEGAIEMDNTKPVADTQEKPQTIDVNAEINRAVDEAKANTIAEVKANTKVITELCQIAGAPEKLAEFLGKDLTVDAVRAELITLRAEKTATEVASHVGMVGESAVGLLASAVEAVRAEKGCTKEQATLTALECNPSLYDKYAAAHPRQFAPVS